METGYQRTIRLQLALKYGLWTHLVAKTAERRVEKKNTTVTNKKEHIH